MISIRGRYERAASSNFAPNSRWLILKSPWSFMPKRYNAAVPSAEGGWTGGRLHSSEYGCRYMLELGKPRSNYQAQAGDEET